MERIDRTQALAHRAAAQGLHRETTDVAALAVLDLGVQDTPPGSATQAIAMRLGEAVPADAPLVTAWTFRGAPHVHRDGDLEELARALWPSSDTDALVRLDTSASPVRATGLPAREALRLVAEAMADIVAEPMPKGAVSTALTPRVPAAMTVDCRVCKATHIVETLFRTAALPAGLAFVPGERTVTFAPIPDWPGVPAETRGLDRLLAAYLHLHGPSTPEAAAAFLGTRADEVRPHWPGDLVEVDLADERAWVPEADLPALRDAPDPPDVRLLPPSDPWLQARDRALVVPDEAGRKALWPILGRPGAVLVRGEVAGTWRARKQGRRLDVTVEPLTSVPCSLTERIAEEARLLAAARGLADAAVH